MNGVVLDEKTGKYLESGHIINHDSALLKKPTRSTFTAETDVVVLKYEAKVF